MRRIVLPLFCLPCLVANAVAESKEQQLQALINQPCAIEFSISKMHDHDGDIMPASIKGFLPTSMRYQEIGSGILRVEGHGTECGDYASFWLRDPRSFDGLEIKKVVVPPVISSSRSDRPK